MRLTLRPSAVASGLAAVLVSATIVSAGMTVPVGDPSLGASARPAATTLSALQVRREQILDSFFWDPRQLGWRIVFAGPRSGYLGMTVPTTRTVYVYVRPGQSNQALRVTLAHEIGHVYDITRGTKAERAAYLRARHASGRAWWPCSTCSDYHVGSGDFAEVFAIWLAGSTDYRSRVAPRPATRTAAGRLINLLA